MSEFYISIDVETFGPIPGPNSMVNLGAAAYTADKVKLGDFDVNLQELAGSTKDASTMEWWNKPAQQEALRHIQQDPQEPSSAMRMFADWADVMTLAARKAAGNNDVKPVLVAYPSGFDFLFVYWYWLKFNKEQPPFWFRCIDIKSFTAGALGVSYRNASQDKAAAPYWPIDKAHTHKGVDDAEEQMWAFFNVRDRVQPAGEK